LGRKLVSLRLALGSAVGLRWAEQQGAEDFVTRALDDMRRRVAAADQSDIGPRRISCGHPIASLSCIETARTPPEIGALINDYWGHYLPQSELIELLRRRKVEVPHVFA